MNVSDRYARSITSSHLEVTEFTGDVDSLIAAGWVREGLSTILWRVRVEFDAVDKQSIGRANCSMTDRLLALVHMRSLAPAKSALLAFITSQAERSGLMLSITERARLTGRVLNHLLDPLCPVCHGVKFKTVPGSGRLSAMPCEACEGLGRERLKFTGNTEAAEVELTREVLDEIDRKMARVSMLMKRFLAASIKAKAVLKPDGARFARPRLGEDGAVFYEFSPDGRRWFRQEVVA